MSETKIVVRNTSPIFGRDPELRYFSEKLISKNNCRILLKGSSGIGKSQFQRTLQLIIRNDYPDFICLHHEIKSTTSTLQDVLSALAIQLLEQADFQGERLSNFRKSLNQMGFDHALSLAIAVLIDTVSLLAPTLKKTTESLLTVLKDTTQNSSYRLTAEKIAKAGKDDLLSGFLRLIEILNLNNIHGCILLDRVEVSSASLLGFTEALLVNLPANWGIVVTVNDEIPDGLKVIEQIRPRIKYVGGEIKKLHDLDFSALMTWTQSVRKETPNVDDVQEVLQNCSGRPLYLKDWVNKLISLENTKLLINDRLGEYYKQRINSLTDDSKWLILRLAIFPANSSFLFDFCTKLFQLRNKEASSESTWKIISELEDKNFLELDSDNASSYRLVHTVIRNHIFTNIPRSVLKEAAASIIIILGNAHENMLESQYDYTEILLASFASKNDIILHKAIPTADKLIASSSYIPALEVYKLYLATSDDNKFNESKVKATLGISIILLHTGYYNEALKNLNSIDFSLEALKDVLFMKPQLDLIRGEILMRLNRYEQANTNLDTAYNSFNLTSNIHGMLEASLHKNTIYRDLGEYETAVLQAESMVILAEKSSTSSLQLASCYLALARSLSFTSRCDKALLLSQKALDIANEKNLLRKKGNAFLTFGEAFRHSKNYSNAIEYYEKAIIIANKITNRDSFLWSALGLSDALLLDQQLIKSQRILDEVGSIVKHSDSSYPLEYLHWNLSQATLDFIGKKITEEEMLLAANKYNYLKVSWPLDYAKELICKKVACNVKLL
jgi:tetratricopeptide (TPR) repeat protein